MAKLDYRAVMYSSEFDPEQGAAVMLCAFGASQKGLDGWLEARLALLRENPELFLRLSEAELLVGMSTLNRLPGAEHTKSTGRRAGGGTLVKGS